MTGVAVEDDTDADGAAVVNTAVDNRAVVAGVVAEVNPTAEHIAFVAGSAASEL